MRDAVREEGPVGEAGQRVVECLMAQLLLQSPAVGDVADRRRNEDALVGGERAEADLDRNLAFILVADRRDRGWFPSDEPAGLPHSGSGGLRGARGSVPV